MELQELVVSIQQIKASSSELSGMVSAAGQGLSTQARNIAALPRPSQSGQQAAMAVSTASQALLRAASSMKTLERTCDDFINSVRK